LIKMFDISALFSVKKKGICLRRFMAFPQEFGRNWEKYRDFREIRRNPEMTFSRLKLSRKKPTRN